MLIDFKYFAQKIKQFFYLKMFQYSRPEYVPGGKMFQYPPYTI